MKYISAIFLAITFLLPTTLASYSIKDVIGKEKQSFTSQNLALQGSSATIPDARKQGCLRRVGCGESPERVPRCTLSGNEYDTQGWNRFSYTKGNPILYKDPTGHQQMAEQPAQQEDTSFSAQVERIANTISQTADTIDQVATSLGPSETPLKGAALGTKLAAKSTSLIAKAIAKAPKAVKAIKEGGKKLLAKIENLFKGKQSPHIDPKKIANKTPEQIDKVATKKGLISKGPDPKKGKGSYVDPKTGKERVLCHPNSCSGPHAHVNNPQGQRLNIEGKIVPKKSSEAHLPIKLDK